MRDSDWPYDVPPETGCITTRQVMHGGCPVLAILHDADGAWGNDLRAGIATTRMDRRVCGRLPRDARSTRLSGRQRLTAPDAVAAHPPSA